VGILHAANDGVADAVKNENITLLHGRDYYNERLCGLKFRVSMFSFFQTNSRGAEVLYGIVKGFSELCPEPYSLFEKSEAKTLTCALDLYCGTGTIAQIVSPLFERVIGVEIVEDAILAAKENAAQNGITNCEFHAADTLHFLSSNIQPLTPNLCLLDPPRDGLHPKALPLIAALGAPAIIYVACKPKSLARDLPILAQNGYFPTKIEAADLFPRTPHLEAVCLLTAQK
jgi:tRNA/tmRNA/rRNA uracil-C5-methylase (TrmA/RlmC/RlmD family)